MKTMYICEKCGKLFETWEDCNICEEGHYSRANISSWEGEGDMEHLKGMELDVYAEGEAMPVETIVKFTRSRYVDYEGEKQWKTEVYYQRAKVTGKPFGNHYAD